LRREEGVAFAVRHCEIDYLRPAWLDDEIQVRSRLKARRGASVVFDHRICRGADTLVRMDVQIVCLRLADGRAVRFPERTRQPFEAFGAAAGPHHNAQATGS
jgi:acyl-CoA thioester hydrolase